MLPPQSSELRFGRLSGWVYVLTHIFYENTPSVPEADIAIAIRLWADFQQTIPETIHSPRS